MIEIAFDKHLDELFQGQKYPQLDVPDLCKKSFGAYVQYARDVFKYYKSERYLIVFSDDKRFNTNSLALAFFIVSCLEDEYSIDCLVVKSKNYDEAFSSYKPYVAVSIGVKYALRLIKESTDIIYKELKCLDYLGFSIREDYVKNSIHYVPHNSYKSSVTTNNVHDALVYASLYKILALAKVETPFELVVKITKEAESLDAEELVFAILQKVSSYIAI